MKNKARFIELPRKIPLILLFILCFGCVYLNPALAGGVWNGLTCQMDDDGTSIGLGNLSVSSSTDDLTGTTVYYPDVVASCSCKFIVVGWANGSGTTGGTAYPEYYQQLASHGFVVAASHSGAANADTILSSVQEVMNLNENSSSPLYQKLKTDTYGVMGKSLGGKAAGDAVLDPAGTGAIAAAMIGFATPDVDKPALCATSDADLFQSVVLNGYDTATSDAIYAEATGLTHMDLSHSVEIAELSTSFMRCYVRGDESACTYVQNSTGKDFWPVYNVKTVGSEALPIEATYSVDGPFNPTEMIGTDYEIYHPIESEMTGNHTIITWGNAAGGTPTMYKPLLQHFASWGFVVVATTSRSSNAALLIGGVDLMAALNDEPGGIFEGKLNLDVVAASGHSLGGGAAIGAANQDPRIQVICIGNSAPQDSTMTVTEGSMFIMGSINDPIANQNILQGIYDNSELPTVWGVLDSGSHFQYMGNGQSFRGYATAWLMAQTQNDSYAQGAFYGDCEICGHPNWTVQMKNMTRVIRLSGDLAFGDVTVGETAQKGLRIWNDGNSTLNITGISLPDGFSGSYSGSIGAGESRDVAIAFAPQAAQYYNGDLTVNSDKTSGKETMACSGTGNVGGGDDGGGTGCFVAVLNSNNINSSLVLCLILLMTGVLAIGFIKEQKSAS